MTRNERLFNYLDSSRDTYADYARKVKATRQQVGNWKKGTHTIPDKYLVRTIEIYKDIDARWLLTGETNELSNDVKELNDKVIWLSDQLLAEKERVIRLQNKIIEGR